MIRPRTMIAYALPLAITPMALAGFGQDTIDLGGLESWSFDGSPQNSMQAYQLTDPGPINDFGYIILGIHYDITIQTLGTSTLSDLNIRFGNSDGTFHGSWPDTFRPGLGFDVGGTQRFTGYFDTDIHLNEDGQFFIELFEGFDDQTGADAVILDGSTMSFSVFIPAPSSAALLGLGTLAACRRRRAR